MTNPARTSQGCPSESSEGSSIPAESIPNSLRSVPAGREATPVPHGWTADRVVKALVGSGHLDAQVAAKAHITWMAARGDGSREPLWRFVARQDGVEAARVFRAAAGVYGFRPVHISLVGTLAVADFLGSVWPKDAYSRLAGISAVPVSAERGSPSSRLVVASEDPGDSELARIMDSLVKGPYDLRYAPESHITECIDAIRKHMPELIPDGFVRLGRRAYMPRAHRRAA